jgi:iron complex transport system substrate-binding protein
MKKIWIYLLTMLLLCSCAHAQEPERVVCLYGSFAEAWLEAGGTLAGVTDDAVSERGLETDAVVIGSTKAPNRELIISLEPDWVILSADIAAQVSAMEVLEAAGLSCTAFRVDTVQDYAAMMDAFTARTGRRDVYEEQVLPMLSEIDAICERAKAHEAPEVLLLRAFSTGAKAKGADNLAGVMLRDLGCVNLVEKYPSLLEELSLESIVTEDPDWIFISVMGGDEEAALSALNASLGANPAFQALTAVREGRMVVLPRELFHYKPNARWSESYACLYDVLFEN